MLRPAPLTVVVVAHPAMPDRDGVLDRLFRRLHRDPDSPFSPAPAVPVTAGSLDAEGTLATPMGAAERMAALVLLDEHAITDTRFCESLSKLAGRAQPDALRVFPVPLLSSAVRAPSKITQLGYLRFDDAPGEARWRRIGSALIHELCRWLQGRIPEAPITVFLSHAKTDGVAIANELIDFFQKQTRLSSFFDAHDLSPGAVFAEELEERIGKSILLVIRTDAYGTREWCQREVLAAKRVGIPVIMIDALESSERRSFPYLGNVPTIRYRADKVDRQEHVLDLLLDETLRQLHFQKRVARLMEEFGEPRPVVLASAPELVSFALTRELERRKGIKRHRRQRRVIYPDPPLSGPEADVLAHDAEAIRADSLTQFVARRAGRLVGVLVAVSISETDEPPAGLSPLHQRDLLIELTRHLLAVGARVAYGGDFRMAGYAELLVEIARSHARFSPAALKPIVSYVPRVMAASKQAPYVDVVEFVHIEDVAKGAGTPARQSALQLRAMRHRMARDAFALVAVGGRRSGFTGWRPGIAEEIAATVAAKRPVYVVGGFGGAAGEYSRAAHVAAQVQNAVALPGLGPEPKGIWSLPPVESVVRTLGKVRNGLSRDENARIAHTIDVDEVVGLVLKGLAATAKPPPKPT